MHLTSVTINCPITHRYCATAECLLAGCCMQRGVAYSQVQQEVPAEVPDTIVQAQADTLEAHSLKYHHCAQIFALSSGRYALFGSYQVASGIDLLAIGTWAELEKHVKAYRALADERAAEPRRISQKPRTQAAAADYADLFGDD